jgi:hypothetical protein
LYSQNQTINAKTLVDNTVNTIKDGIGKLSQAAQSGAQTASLKIKSIFEKKDMQARTGTAKGGTTPEQSKADSKDTMMPTGALTYPATMKYYTLFSFKKYQRGFALETPKDIPTVSIVLPIPSNLNETFGVDYDTPALGPIVGAVAGSTLAGQRSAEEGGDFNSALQSASDTRFMSIAKDLGGAAAIGVAQKASGETGKALASIAGGVAPNPHLAVVMRNIGLREHSFSYRFAPNSEAELKTVKNIIKQLKIRMLPGMTSGADALFTYPDMCDISFRQGTLESFKIKRCVLKNLSINYAPNGPAFFRTGDPVVVEISMSFMEMSPFTRRDMGEKDLFVSPPAPAKPNTATAAGG